MSFDLVDDFARSRGKLSTEFVQRIMNRLGKFDRSLVLDELLMLAVKHEDTLAIHDLTESFTNVDSGDFDESDRAAEGNDLRLMLKSIPSTITNLKVYSVTHTMFGTWSFPHGTTKFGGRTTLDGNQYEQMAPYESSTQMDIGTGAFGVTFFVKNLGAGTYGIVNKRDIQNTTNAGIEIWLSSGTTLNCRIADGTNTALLSQVLTGVDLTEDVWHSVTVNIPATGNMEVLADKVSKGTQARGSVANVNNSRDAYIFARDNNGTIQDKAVGDFSNLVWKKGEIFDSTQITDYNERGS
jgi:hypothetical protein